jgi:tetratricopeptide (TPR) repeat protein
MAEAGRRLAMRAAAALLVPALALAAGTLENPTAPADMAAEALGGEGGPFYPSAARTADGRPIPAAAFAAWRTCGQSGCHPDVAAEWAASPHRFAGFDNPWFRASFERAREDLGTVPARWCGGCHSPALLLSGGLDRPVPELAAAAELAAGVPCAACHLARARSTMGQADFEVELPRLQRMAGSRNPLVRTAYGLRVRRDLEAHRRAYRPDPEICSTCHKSHLDRPVNGDHWFRVMDDHSSWQVGSDAARTGVRLPVSAGDCMGCHMPPGAAGRSHRFAAANTALPALRNDRDQLAAVTRFLQAGGVTVDLFAMTRGVAAGAAPSSVPAEEIFGPLDRLPATVRRGESTRVDALVRTPGVGHLFPGGKSDIAECWLELRAVDDRGRTLFWSGRADEGSPVDPGAHFFRTLWTDGDARPVERHEAWKARAVVYRRLIEPQGASVVRFRLEVPADAGERIRLTARLRYRTFPWDFTRWVFERLRVSPPRPPIVTLAEDQVDLAVVPAEAPLPDLRTPEPREGDFERWTAYAAALAAQGDFPASRVARLKVRRPDDPATLLNRALAADALQDSIPLLERAAALDPGNGPAHLYAGLALRDEGNLEGALAHLRKAAAIYPDNPEIRRDIGNILMAAGDFEGARDELLAALALDPEDPGAHISLRQVYRVLGDRAAADRHQALFQRFKTEETAPALAHRYLEGHPEDAREQQGIHEHRSAPLGDIR